MVYIAMAYVLMALCSYGPTVMAYMIIALHSYGLYSDGLYS